MKESYQQQHILGEELIASTDVCYKMKVHRSSRHPVLIGEFYCVLFQPDRIKLQRREKTERRTLSSRTSKHHGRDPRKTKEISDRLHREDDKKEMQQLAYDDPLFVSFAHHLISCN